LSQALHGAVLAQFVAAVLSLPGCLPKRAHSKQSSKRTAAGMFNAVYGILTISERSVLVPLHALVWHRCMAAAKTPF
jgi:hypothetical protein